MTNILADWVGRKFVIADNLYNDSQYVVVLTDFKYWISVSDELLLWCEKNNCTKQYVTVNIPDEKTLTLFYLRWS